MKKITFLFILLGFISVSKAQTDSLKIWKETNYKSIKKKISKSKLPKEFKVFKCNLEELNKQLNKIDSTSKQTIVSIPNLDGKIYYFSVEISETMSSDLQKKFPQIKSYKGTDINTKQLKIRADKNVLGFNAFIQGQSNTHLLQQYSPKHPNLFILYDKKYSIKTNKYPY